MSESTAGYSDEAAALLKSYETITTADVQRKVIHLVPLRPCDLLDIGAGTGRDAATFAGLGHRVVAVEPTDELRRQAQALHPSERIDWVADGLPDLKELRARQQTFDVVMMTAVWMHLDKDQRARAMPVVVSLMRPGAVLTMSLRHGPVPAGRRMFDVSGEETIALAAAEGLSCVLHTGDVSILPGKGDVSWTWLGFRKA